MAALRQLLGLSGSVLIGQLAVIGFGVADTVMLGRFSTADSLAVLSLGQAIYITLFVALSGVTQALLPTLGRAHGAGSAADVGSTFRQGLWLCAGLSVPGIAALLWPQPLLALAGQAGVAGVERYLQILALGLPAALAFRAHAAFGQAVSRPLQIAVAQIAGLLLKIGLNLLVLRPDLFGLAGQPSLGATGCAITTVVTQWSLLALAAAQHLHGAAFKPFAALRRWERPSWPVQAHLLRLGGPTGLSLLVEVSAFTFIALFIARLGDVVLAAHQIAANFATVLYMLPLSVAIATSALVAQHLGAGRRAAARHTAWHGIGVAAALAVVVAVGVWTERSTIAGWYTSDAAVRRIAEHLLLFIALIQLADAVQVSCALVLRSYHVAILPGILYALALWGIGLWGGYVLAFNTLGISPAGLQGAAGFWMGNAAGLGLAASSLALLLWRVARRD